MSAHDEYPPVRSRLANILDNATRYLRDMRRTPEPEDLPSEPRHVTRKGNGITLQSESKWQSDATGLKEFKHHVGRSAEGYHGGVEVSHQGGEAGFFWSNARRTPQAAERASYGVREWYEREDKVKEDTPQLKSDGVPFRYQKPFAHLEHDMTPKERDIVAGIEARWKERYERFKDYPPMSDGLEHESAVFHAVDRLHKTLDARETGQFEDWKRLEKGVERAMGSLREVFREQRRFVAQEVAEEKACAKQMNPGNTRGRKSPSWER